MDLTNNNNPISECILEQAMEVGFPALVPESDLTLGASLGVCVYI